jgi:hypothetical protein
MDVGTLALILGAVLGVAIFYVFVTSIAPPPGRDRKDE